MYYPVIDRSTLYENLHIYCFLILLFLLVGIFAYIKLRYPFWNLQPVYHTYDFWRGFWREPFFIYKKAISTKFVDIQAIDTIAYEDLTEDQRKAVINILQCYYLPSENTNFMFHLENLESYMVAHLSTSYISLYNRVSFIPNNGSVIKDSLGCITSRSGSLIIGNWKTPIYFIDFIAMHRDAPLLYWRKLLQTHLYKQQLKTPEIMGSIMKKEGEPYDGVVPFIQTTSSLYEIAHLIYEKKSEIALPEHFILIDFHKGNIDLLFDFLEGYQKRFAVFCMTDKPALLRMIEHKILFVYGIKNVDEIFAIYIFRDLRTVTEEKGDPKGLLQLVGSISNSSSADLFYRGFQLSLRSVIKRAPVFGLLTIEDISHNGILYDRIGRLSIAANPMGYYLYNIVCPGSPFYGSQSFVLF
jgi:hypothetical protein